MNNKNNQSSHRKIDTHLHGLLSSDSTLEYHALCRKAIQLGYTDLILTEHFDLLPKEIAQYGIISLHKYHQCFIDLQQSYPELNLIWGIELGEPHRVQELTNDIFHSYHPEYIIGSLHVTRSERNVSLRIDTPLHENEIKEYYKENLEMCEQGGFDVLGHLGIYQRGLVDVLCIPQKSINYLIDEIFRVMIQKNIGLEINFSGFRSPWQNIIPEPKILIRYRKLGGELITISSDSHALNHFNDFYDKTLDILKELNIFNLSLKNHGNWEQIPL